MAKKNYITFLCIGFGAGVGGVSCILILLAAKSRQEIRMNVFIFIWLLCILIIIYYRNKIVSLLEKNVYSIFYLNFIDYIL